MIFFNDFKINCEDVENLMRSFVSYSFRNQYYDE